ncbi:MAG: hypothetical protein UU93_C0008G0025, partial [Candidatus Amesbacteria bacterium GW2011_GWA2_42_12]
MNSAQPKIIRQSAEERKKMVEDVVLRGMSVNEVTRLYNVSRKTYAKWKKRYNAHTDCELNDANPKGVQHHRGAKPEAYDQVMELVKSNPSFSSRKISENLKFIGGHGVQNILKRLNLSTYEQRMNYANSFVSISPVLPPIVRSVPVSNPKTDLIRVFTISLASGVLISGFFVALASLYGESASVGHVFGISFALLALLLGTFFFLYSTKYYITLALVLS